MRILQKVCGKCLLWEKLCMVFKIFAPKKPYLLILLAMNFFVYSVCSILIVVLLLLKMFYYQVNYMAIAVSTSALLFPQMLVFSVLPWSFNCLCLYLCARVVLFCFVLFFVRTSEALSCFQKFWSINTCNSQPMPAGRR